MAISLGSVGTTWGFIEARRESRQALLAQRESDGLAEFMIQLFKAGRPSEDTQGLTARQLLDRGAEALESELGDQPLRQAQLKHALGQIYLDWRLYDEATPLLNEALESYEGRPKTDVRYIELLDSVATLRIFQKQIGEAQAMLEQALSLSRQLELDDVNLPASLHNHLGSLLLTQHEKQRSEQELDAAYSLLVDHPDAQPEILAEILRARARFYRRTGRMEEALASLDECIALLELALGPDHYRLIQPLSDLGWFYRIQSRYEDAERVWRRALTLNEAEMGVDSYSSAGFIRSLADVSRDLGRFEEAVSLYRRSLRLLRREGPSLPIEGPLLQSLGSLLMEDLGRLQEAEEVFLQAEAHRREIEPHYGKHRWRLGETLVSLGRLYNLRGETDRAEVKFRQTTELEPWRSGSPEAPDGLTWRGDAYRELARLYQARGQIEAAKNALEAAVKTYGEKNDQAREGLALQELETLQAN